MVANRDTLHALTTTARIKTTMQQVGDVAGFVRTTETALNMIVRCDPKLTVGRASWSASWAEARHENYQAGLLVGIRCAGHRPRGPCSNARPAQRRCMMVRSQSKTVRLLAVVLLGAGHGGGSAPLRGRSARSRS